VLSAQAREHFRARGFQLPTRCEPCRAKRRLERTVAETLTGVVSKLGNGDFGFIECADRGTFFFHMAAVAQGDLPLHVGDIVVFQAPREPSSPGQRPVATAVRLAE